MSFREAFFNLSDSVYKIEVFIPCIKVVQTVLVYLELHVRLALGLLVDNKNNIFYSVCDEVLES